jgi:hypothetical protein
MGELRGRLRGNATLAKEDALALGAESTRETRQG